MEEQILHVVCGREICPTPSPGCYKGQRPGSVGTYPFHRGYSFSPWCNGMVSAWLGVRLSFSFCVYSNILFLLPLVSPSLICVTTLSQTGLPKQKFISSILSGIGKIPLEQKSLSSFVLGYMFFLCFWSKILYCLVNNTFKNF